MADEGTAGEAVRALLGDIGSERDASRRRSHAPGPDRDDSPWLPPWPAIFAVGIVLRALAAYPPFRSPVESDGTMTGLTALEILDGHLRVFLFHGVRLGAPESYLQAPLVLLFGATRGALYLAPFLVGCSLLAAFAFLARELLGDRAGRAACVLFAVPPPMVLLWTYLPFGYAETLLCAAVALACAVRIARDGGTVWLAAAFGVAVGLGWWCSALSLMATLPAAAWIVVRRPALLSRMPVLGAAVAGILVGALPWIAINIRYPLLSFQPGAEWQRNFALQTAGSLDQLVANGVRFVHRAAALLLREDGPRPAWLAPLVAAAGLLHVAAFALAVLQVRAEWKAPDLGGARAVPPAVLPLSIAVCTAAFFVASAAGAIEGDTVRYVLPLGLAAPLLLAGLWRRLGNAVLVVLLVAHVSGYCLPGSARRQREHEEAAAEDRLLDLLNERNVAWVIGGYWDVYALNFLSHETVKAIPTWDWADYHGYERRLGSAPLPGALVSRRPGQVALWARRAGLRGDLADVDGAFEAFFPNAPDTEKPAALIARVRDAQQPDPLPAADCRSRITRVRADETSGEPGTLRLRIENAGGVTWTSAADLPTPVRAVRVGVRWLRGDIVAADRRIELPRSLAGGEAAEVDVPLAPRRADGTALPSGRYEVRIGLVQELVRWFADVGDRETALDVDVRNGRAAPVDTAGNDGSP